MMQAGVFAVDGTVNYNGFYDVPTMLSSVPKGWYEGWRRTSWLGADAGTEVLPRPGVTYDHCANYHF